MTEIIRSVLVLSLMVHAKVTVTSSQYRYIISDITVRPVTLILSPMVQQCKNVSQCLSVDAVRDVASLPGGNVSQPKTTIHRSVKLP